ncbi:hypothetical protein LPB90_18365 [Chryseobacterium sp. LC2016-29]|uniref:hypothetical protein n=1 Tax=Chryseobacterium sp. LC2016-29 TaxID=2897331 RepID=UPI001E55CEA5|nr:hypothetical protein [Chryseobacterium sp. LC2016-29]MCD0480407.1 hypothetical protein [Chryseobacterium sp. LC2016-29]
MDLIKQNHETVQIEFTLEEYFRIKGWLSGKPAENIDIETRDALENLINISAWINPDINIEYDTKFSSNIQQSLENGEYIKYSPDDAIGVSGTGINYQIPLSEEEKKDFNNLK